MNYKHRKLATAMAREIKHHFPGLNARVGPSRGSADVWIHIAFPANHQKELAVRDLAAELSIKYLDEHNVLILPVSGSYQPAGH